MSTAVQYSDELREFIANLYYMCSKETDVTGKYALYIYFIGDRVVVPREYTRKIRPDKALIDITESIHHFFPELSSICKLNHEAAILEWLQQAINVCYFANMSIVQAYTGDL